MTNNATQPFRIVAAVDGSENAHAVVERALDAAGRYESDEVHFLRVVDKRGNPGELDNAYKELTALVTEKLTDFASASEKAENRRARIHVTTGKPAEEILQFAEDVQARLIVIGRHGEAGRLRDRFGTVPSRIIRDARCAVLVEQAPEYFAPQEACVECVDVRSLTDGDQWFCDSHSDGYKWKSGTLIASSFTALHGGH